MQDTIYKALMFLFWPLLAVFIVVMLAFILACAWPVMFYGVATRPLTPRPGFAVRSTVKQSDLEGDDDSVEIMPIVRFHWPAGQWRADHIPAVRSVFDLGVAA